MDALSTTKDELISMLQESKFEHLSQNEQARLREYLQHILMTLQEATERRRFRRTMQKRIR